MGIYYNETIITKHWNQNRIDMKSIGLNLFSCILQRLSLFHRIFIISNVSIYDFVLKVIQLIV